MTEPLMVWLILSAIFCWLAGGRGWPPFHKNWRRVVFPFIAGAILLISHIAIGTAFLVGFTLWLTLILPYGDTTPGWARPLVFASYVLPSAFLSTQLLGVLLLVSLAFLTIWWALSHKFNAWTQVTWESLAALIQASSLIVARLAM